MSAMFGGENKNRDIKAIVDKLQGSSLCNESVAGTALVGVEIENMSDSIRNLMLEHYEGYMPKSEDHVHLDAMLIEDATNAAKMFKNNLVDEQILVSPNPSKLNEAATAVMPNLVTLTASIATTMRTPYEAVLHRLFDTRTLDKQMVEIEEVIPTIRAPGDEDDEDMIDALAPYAPVPFVDRTEIMVDTLVDGLPMNSGRVRLLEGKNPNFRINRDVRVTHIDVEIDGVKIDQKNIRLAKGYVPFFDGKDNQMTCVFNVTKPDGEVVPVDISAKLDFEKSVMEWLRGSDLVKKVYFYATVSHHEHTHPIHTSFRNNFEQFVVPTRPHIEVSLPLEMRTDIANSINHFANTDIVTAMTENITVISSRMEDQRLKKCLETDFEYEAQFPFEAPANFAYGNLEWLRREFIPFLDQCALKLKNDRNITDCHFRVGVSPYILRILDTDYTMDKAMTEESRGSGVINYSIGVKTSTSVFYFVSSQQFKDNMLQMLLIPNNYKMSQVKTYNYYKYSSFLTDQLRRSDNSVQPAIVYSERNLPLVFTPLCTTINIADMPIMATEGAQFVRRVGMHN